MNEAAGDPARVMRFVLEMRQAGITDARVLAALERTARAPYAPAHLIDLALEDAALPLAHGQSMTKPSVIGRAVMALDVQAGMSVLEVGTGSGYQTAVLAALARKVTSLERWRDLAAEARARFGLARLMHVEAHGADGLAGWAEGAPYDRIILNGAVAEIPPALLAQLAPGGLIAAPIGAGETQILTRVQQGAQFQLGPVKFQRLEPGMGPE